jgi:hypothetical protein
MPGYRMLSDTRLVSIAEDLEHFAEWWAGSGSIDNATIRRGSASLRRLLVEDAAGKAWRQLGLEKEPRLQAPDLIAFYADRGIDPAMVTIAAAAGVRYSWMDAAFLGGRRVDHPETGVLAAAEEGFAVAVSTVARNSENPQPSEFDKFIDRESYLHEYLDAPGLVRTGKILSRREVIKHMANEMGGVHVAKSGSEVRDLLLEAEDKLIIQMKSGEIRGQYIEVLAIGQAVGRSLDLRNLAAKIRERLNAHSL